MGNLQFVSSILINGKRCYDYQSLMQHLKLSLHINGLQRRMSKYHSHFLQLNGRYYLSEDYAQLLADFRKLYSTREAIQTRHELNNFSTL